MFSCRDYAQSGRPAVALARHHPTAAQDHMYPSGTNQQPFNTFPSVYSPDKKNQMIR